MTSKTDKPDKTDKSNKPVAEKMTSQKLQQQAAGYLLAAANASKTEKKPKK